MFIEALLTAAALGGLALCYFEEAFGLARSLRGGKARRSPRMKKAAAATEASFAAALSRLLLATAGIRSRRAPYWFTALAACPALAVFLLLQSRVPLLLAYIAALLAFAAPFLALLCRLQAIRSESSREGDVMIIELLDNYRMNFFNMQQAIEVTAVTLSDAPHARRLLFDLSRGLNTAAGGEEIRALLDELRFAIGTSWAGVLADNMYLALTADIRVNEALEDLLHTVEKARRVAEFARRENNEGRLIIKYLAPCCYLATVLAAVKYFGLTPAEFIHYQFMTGAGMVWLVVVIITYGAGVIAQAFLTRGRLDI